MVVEAHMENKSTSKNKIVSVDSINEHSSDTR